MRGTVALLFLVLQVCQAAMSIDQATLAGSSLAEMRGEFSRRVVSGIDGHSAARLSGRVREDLSSHS